MDPLIVVLYVGAYLAAFVAGNIIGALYCRHRGW